MNLSPSLPIRLLIVDDDPQIRSMLAEYLATFGMEADGAEGGAAMRSAMSQNSYDLVILDLSLHGENGLTLCRELRDQGNTPVIMLTARAELADRVVGLEVGADDYVTKPFEMRELVARIHTVLRRSRADNKRSAVAAGHELRFANWRLNTTLRQLVDEEDTIVPLSNAEFRLLLTFIEHPNRVLDREVLINQARGRDLDVFDRSIDLLVSRLRQKLRDDPRDSALIRTVRGEGYVFTGSVEH
ncbi:response regulator [Cupriavidus plantarum]|uniref:Winged helix family two component transcriptional regulator n=1 Tax=Cupriavidus plantarum TaxID=942865 RepID=A0A316EPC6_9BURK|nr:response regulator transcription factor [Cupriavidus plantarum]NYH97324.1 two-component system OmpR family response regulator [Cupriavidus plantarum]PWK31966.1 winged helix family two component transcriptional regulator [Cupriavidus plantarum]REE86289.1 winged helix family two component transcriptional regulator [Cupriavidus plantarum]RLK29115.1 winged helix family two component transcriptional regulator [Cupriavidus plantarum]CAG2149920.1 Transcriptional regulatory protein OmpR [Cupriavidu